MANIDEKILKALETLQTDVTSMKGDVTTLKNGQARTETALDALKAGQDEIRVTMATKADVQDIAAKIDKYQRKNEQRFENLEEATGAHNPHKN